jgi:hypothetical protein
MKLSPAGSTVVTNFCCTPRIIAIKDSPNQGVSAMNFEPRSNPARRFACALFFAGLFFVGLAGCVPAHHVQRSQLAKPCDVTVCTNIGTGLERCDCTRYRHLETQMQRVIGAAP